MRLVSALAVRGPVPGVLPAPHAPFAGMEAVLLENDSPGQWILFTRREFEPTMAKLGFVEKLADGD